MKQLVITVAIATLVACGGGGSTTASVKNDGIQGTFRGTLQQGSTEVSDHEVTVMTDGKGNSQLGIWEFCNIDLQGSGPSYTSVEGSSCLVALADGKKRGHGARADVRHKGNTLSAKVTFDDGTVWTYEGKR